MKTNFILLTIFAIIMILSMAGCYTQLGTTNDDREEYSTVQQQDDTTFVSGNENVVEREYSGCCDENDRHAWDYRPSVGFSFYYPSYYWPSYAFSVAYRDPWFYDYYWAYDPWFYSPAYAWSPYHWYYPAYYYPYYWGGYNYGYATSPQRNNRRDFGSTRGSRDVRNDGFGNPITTQTNSNLPTGARIVRSPDGSGSSNKNQATLKEGSRRGGSQRSAAQSNNRGSRSYEEYGVRGSSMGGRSSRGETRRDIVPQHQPSTTSSQPPPAYRAPSSGNPAPRGETHRNPDAGSSRGSSPSYTPPPPPSQSSPPPPSSNSGNQSGGSRGRKP